MWSWLPDDVSKLLNGSQNTKLEQSWHDWIRFWCHICIIWLFADLCITNWLIHSTDRTICTADTATVREHSQWAAAAGRRIRIDRYWDRDVMFYAQSTAKGHIRAKQHVTLQQVKFWFRTWNTFHRWRLGDILRKWSWMSREGRN